MEDASGGKRWALTDDYRDRWEGRGWGFSGDPLGMGGTPHRRILTIAIDPFWARQGGGDLLDGLRGEGLHQLGRHRRGVVLLERDLPTPGPSLMTEAFLEGSQGTGGGGDVGNPLRVWGVGGSDPPPPPPSGADSEGAVKPHLEVHAGHPYPV